jgi:hypothetical protein
LGEREVSSVQPFLSCHYHIDILSEKQTDQRKSWGIQIVEDCTLGGRDGCSVQPFLSCHYHVDILTETQTDQGSWWGIQTVEDCTLGASEALPVHLAGYRNSSNYNPFRKAFGPSLHLLLLVPIWSCRLVRHVQRVAAVAGVQRECVVVVVVLAVVLVDAAASVVAASLAPEFPSLPGTFVLHPGAAWHRLRHQIPPWL